MSSVQPTYPNAILTWNDRTDGVTVVDANDVNTLGSEIISIETNLGVNLQQEPNPPVGTAISYATVSARITDAQNNAKMPVCALSNASVTLANVAGGTPNLYIANYDPYKMYNGTDITIPASGWWVISASQTWAWWNAGYSYMSLALNGFTNLIDDDMINWQFPGNTVTQGVPGRWQIYGRRPRLTKVFFQGPAHAGDRFSVLSENGTTNATQTITGLSLKASMVVSFEGNTNFVSG